MRIQHNIMAMSAYRNYTNNVSAMKKNLEKLSSGYKINRAGDDAAGLAISEKMRAQITGLETAQKNAKDGISLVQTAEGALTEVHDMLNRMVELATQSANGTYEDSVDRKQLQKEVGELQEEINRISKASNFNGIQLLDGTYSGTVSNDFSDVSVTSITTGNQGAKAEASAVYTIDVHDKLQALAGKTALKGSIKLGNTEIGTIKSTATGGVVLMVSSAAAAASVTIAGIDYKVEADGNGFKLTAGKAPTKDDEIAKGDQLKATLTTTSTAGTTGADTNHSYDLGVHVDTAPVVGGMNKVAQGSFTLSANDVKDGAQLKVGDTTYTFKVGANGTGSGGTVIDLSAYEEGDADLLKAAYDALSKEGKNNTLFDMTTDGTKMYLTEKIKAVAPKYESQVDYKTTWDLSKATGWNTAVAGGTKTGAVVQKKGVAAAAQTLQLQIGDTNDPYNQLQVKIGACDTGALGIAGVDISTQAGATTAIKKIKDAINTVSDIRGTLGATQNRLEHTINNLSVMTENIQDAESTIRDTDVAEEMMAYTKNNILIQSAQAMLAQANQVPQGVLQLLQ